MDDQQQIMEQAPNETNTEVSQAPEEQVTSTTQAHTDATEEPNVVRRLREQLAREKQEKAEIANRYKQLEESQYRPAPQRRQEAVPDENPDEPVTRGELLERERQWKFERQYPDFDKVVTQDTISMLNEKAPRLAQSLSEIQDERTKAKAVYETIKDLGLFNEDHYGTDREKAQSNANKPRPVNSIAPQKGESPISQANAFAEGSEGYYKNLWKEMNQCRKKA